MRIKLGNGKYELIIHDNGEMEALRHGEPWRDLTGDNLILHMVCEIERLTDEVSDLKFILHDLGGSNE